MDNYRKYRENLLLQLSLEKHFPGIAETHHLLPKLVGSLVVAGEEVCFVAIEPQALAAGAGEVEMAGLKKVQAVVPLPV